MLLKEIKELNRLLKNQVFPKKILKDKLISIEELYRKCREEEKKNFNGKYTDVSLKLEGQIDLLKEILQEE